MLDSLLTVPKELTQPERDNTFKFFKNLPPEERDYTNHCDIDLPERPTLFIKWGDDVLVEASTQSFFYALAQKDKSAPGIPKVYDAFCKEGYCFFAMEKIKMPTLSTCKILEDDAAQSAASAVKWLLAQMPSVPDSVFGRISSEEACVWHRFFKDHQAPVPFVNSEALTKYVNKAFSRLPGNSARRSISFSNDLFIYHSDIRKDNFLYDIETGDIWIIDFQHIGVLPKPFQTYAFFNTCSSFSAAVGRHLGHKPTDIAGGMAYASCLLQQTGGCASLNLDKFGERVHVGIRETSCFPPFSDGSDLLVSRCEKEEALTKDDCIKA